MLDSLVRVSRRVAENHLNSILAEARSSIQIDSIARKAITLPEGSYIPQAFIQPPEPMLSQLTASAQPRRTDDYQNLSLILSASLSTISRTF